MAALLAYYRADDVVAPPVSVKIESADSSPTSQSRHDDCHYMSASHKASCKQDDDSFCRGGHGSVLQGEFSSGASRLHRRSRSGSRSPRLPPPLSTSGQSGSRGHQSRRSVDIKTECTTPTLRKKSSRCERDDLERCVFCTNSKSASTLNKFQLLQI